MECVEEMSVCGVMAGAIVHIRLSSICSRCMEAKCMVSEGRKYILDRRTSAVKVQERGRVRGVGPSRKGVEPRYISTILLKSINVVGLVFHMCGRLSDVRRSRSFLYQGDINKIWTMLACFKYTGTREIKTESNLHIDDVLTTVTASH
jgi:hypothetical protein